MHRTRQNKKTLLKGNGLQLSYGRRKVLRLYKTKTATLSGSRFYNLKRNSLQSESFFKLIYSIGFGFHSLWYNGAHTKELVRYAIPVLAVYSYTGCF
jgi:hypothetical protein